MAKKETEKEEKKSAKKEAVKDEKKAVKSGKKDDKKTVKKSAKDDKKSGKKDDKKSDGKKKKKEKLPDLPDNALPQNIIAIGERVEEDKNIYIVQDVYKQIHKFTKNKLTNEAGGMLVGHVIEEFGKTNIMITGFVEAKHSEGTPTTLTFTHETWDYVHGEIDKKYPGKKILGWIHTHPDFGIFLSDYDKFIHENFFNDDNQIAYVIDPIRKVEGLYFWINGKLTKCNGFYIYDRTGQKIEMTPVEDKKKKDDDKKEGEAAPAGNSLFQNVLLVLLSIIVLVLTFTTISLSNRINSLLESQVYLIQLIGQNSSSISSVQSEIYTVEEILGEIANVVIPEETTGDETTGDETGTETGTETGSDTTGETKPDSSENSAAS